MDLIDRQALLKQIEIDSDGEPGYYGDTWKFIDTIKNLPSATDKNVGTKLGTNLASLGTDCISRQAAIDALSTITMYKGSIPFDTAVMRIKQLPPIQPEIVRCKDCKHFESEYGYCDYYQWNMTGGDFCSKAERREVTT